MFTSSRDRQRQTREHIMTKFFCIIAALGFFAPAAFATLNQAALIVA